jgi:hypothetical protein
MRALILVLAFIAFTLPAVALEGIGGVVAVRGDVTVVRGDATLDAAPGFVLERGDRIVTGAGGRALLQLEGGLTVSVASATELVLAELRATPQTSALAAWIELVEGLVRAVLSAPAAEADVQVRTPVAVTSVRSTEWTVEHAPEHTAVFCRDGAVAVSAAGTSVVLGPGDGTDVRGAAAPTAPVAWGAPRIERTLARTRLVAP